MTVELDEVVRVGGVAIAALVERSVRRERWPPVSVFGAKRPAAILIRDGDGTRAFDPNGTPMALDELDRRFPGQRTNFERLAG